MDNENQLVQLKLKFLNDKSLCKQKQKMDSGFFPLIVLLKMTNQAWAGFGFIPGNS